MEIKRPLTLVEEPKPKTLEELQKEWDTRYEELEKQGLGKKTLNSDNEKVFKWNLVGCTSEQQENLHKLAEDLLSGRITQMNEDDLVEL